MDISQYDVMAPAIQAPNTNKRENKGVRNRGCGYRVKEEKRERKVKSCWDTTAPRPSPL